MPEEIRKLPTALCWRVARMVEKVPPGYRLPVLARPEVYDHDPNTARPGLTQIEVDQIMFAFEKGGIVFEDDCDDVYLAIDLVDGVLFQGH